MNLKEKIKYHKKAKNYCRVKRKVGKNKIENTDGYVLDYSDKFVLMQEVFDFAVGAYYVFPLSTVSKIRFCKTDKYFTNILAAEGEADNCKNRHEIDLSNWESVFKSIQSTGLSVIVENENPNDETFDIGPITKVTKKAVFVRYFNSTGLLNREPSRLEWNRITVARFDDRYANIFSKHLRESPAKPK
jgi:hypothetical protein